MDRKQLVYTYISIAPNTSSEQFASMSLGSQKSFVDRAFRCPCGDRLVPTSMGLAPFHAIL